MNNETDPQLDAPVELPGEGQPPQHPQFQPASSNGDGKAKKIILIVAALIVVGALAGAAVMFLGRDKSTDNQTATPPPAPAAAPQPQAKSDVPAATNTETFDSGFLGVGLTYPDTWTATETDDNGVRVVSPDFTYEKVDGDEVSGNFRIYIRKGARAADSKVIGRGVAIAPSEKINYTKPAVGQRTDTLLQHFGLDDTSNFNYVFVAGNFELKPGDTLGPNYGKEAETFIIAGGFSSDTIDEDMIFNSIDPDTYKDSTAYKQAVDIIKSLELH